MNPMTRLSHATMEQIQEYMSQHGIKLKDPVELIGGGYGSFTNTQEGRFYIVSRTDSWPVVHLQVHFLPRHNRDMRLKEVDITDGFEEILDLYNQHRYDLEGRREI